MDASNGPPIDSRLIAAPTVAPPPGIRPMAQPNFSQPMGSQLGLSGLAAAGFRQAQFAAAAASGLPLFQAQAPPMAMQSTCDSRSMGPRKGQADRSKSASGAGASRKQCNCKHSRCLKLYCECFASGRYCSNCNCVQCYNNREHEATRQSAVEAILERNPNAFRPKIQSNDPVPTAVATAVSNSLFSVPGRHLKGCNCKKSSCLKKYCECFQAGIYCSDNCKCIECRNFEDALGPGGTKRVRPSSHSGHSGVSLSAFRQAGGFGSLAPPQPPQSQQQQQQQYSAPAVASTTASGLQMGTANAIGGGTAPGSARPGSMGGSLACMGPGGVGGLPQALSLALAAASGSGQQLMLMPPASSGGQLPGGPLGAPGTQPQAAGTLPPPLPLRVKMQEVVNGMVKRSVIEELCRLLWMVADDEAAPARTASSPAAVADAAASLALGRSNGSGSTLQSDGVVTGGDPGSTTPSQANGGSAAVTSTATYVMRTAARGPPTLQHAAVVVAAVVSPEQEAGSPGGMACDKGASSGGRGGNSARAALPVVKVELDDEPETQAPGLLHPHPVAQQQPHDAGLTSGVVEDGVQDAGGPEQETAAAAAGGSTPDVQQQSQWPGTLYGRKERVVLEEFLSIMNKISETAAKKLQQHAAAAAAASSGVIQPLPLSLQPQQQSLQVPGILAGGQGQAVKQSQGTQQPFGYAPVGSLMMPVMYPLGSYSAAGGMGANGAVSSATGGSSSHAAAHFPQAHMSFGVAGSSSVGQDGVAVVVPPGVVGPSGAGGSDFASASAFPAAQQVQQQHAPSPSQALAEQDPQSSQQQQQACGQFRVLQQQPELLPHPLHGDVPVILAPPRGSNSSGGNLPPPAPHPQLQPQQQQALHAFGHLSSQPAAGAGYSGQFMSFNSAVNLPSDGNHAHHLGKQRQPQYSEFRDGHHKQQQRDALLQGILTASEQQLALWDPSGLAAQASQQPALLQPPTVSHQQPQPYPSHHGDTSEVLLSRVNRRNDIFTVTEGRDGDGDQSMDDDSSDGCSAGGSGSGEDNLDDAMCDAMDTTGA